MTLLQKYKFDIPGSKAIISNVESCCALSGSWKHYTDFLPGCMIKVQLSKTSTQE